MNDLLLSKLAALRAEYARTLPGLIDGLTRAVQAWLAAPGDPALASEVKRISHRICGTAGSYGFGEISVACKEIETLSETLSAAEAQERLLAALGRAERAAHAAAAA